MAIVYGQIESLKKIRETLDQKRISRFNSIGDINKFNKNYEYEKENLFFEIEREFDLELDVFQAEGFALQKNYDSIKTDWETKLNRFIDNLKTKMRKLSSYASKNPLKEVGYWYLLQIYIASKIILERGYNSIIWVKTFRANKRLKSTIKKINSFQLNRQTTISNRYASKIKELEYTKTAIDNLYPLIAGAVGENLVEKELRKLSNDYILFNDFSLKFEKPIYNKKENDRIHSIQIDHLLVTRAGVFNIETKNWSKNSLARYDLRSPVEQIQRASFALFIVLNGKKSEGSRLLQDHHWGDKKLPIRNIIAMINHKPREKFKFVTIKNLKELNNYINYFEPILNDYEVKNIADYLKKIQN